MPGNIEISLKDLVYRAVSIAASHETQFRTQLMTASSIHQYTHPTQIKHEKRKRKRMKFRHEIKNFISNKFDKLGLCSN